MTAARELANLAPRFGRLACDCCDERATHVLDPFPFYLCEVHLQTSAEEQEALFRAKYAYKGNFS